MPDEAFETPVWTPELRARLAILAASFQRLTGRTIAPAGGDQALALWAHPAVIVAHGTEPDPVFFFGNRAALGLFELDFPAFTRLPSRLSAEPMLREARTRLLERVSAHGVIDDYSGIRVSSTGRRFRIEQATVWTLADEAGALHGQAAMFEHWTPV